MVLESLIQNEARFQVQQDEALARFRDTNETQEQIEERLKKINEMMQPKEILTSTSPSSNLTYEQIMRKQRDEYNNAVMFKSGKIRQEIKELNNSTQN